MRDNQPLKRFLPIAVVTTSTIRAHHEEHATTDRSAPDNLLESCVRVRVKDARGTNVGSGTIVDSRIGRSLILSCGHLFRDLSADALIEVDVFVDDRSMTYAGRLVGFDLAADVGLLALATTAKLAATVIASDNSPTNVGEQVVSVGCSGGEPPSRQTLQITAVNRYQGPDNIECNGVPVQGRSGGGLLNASGQVIGVCIAADPRDRRGLYAGLQPIHALLAQHGLDHLRRRPERPTETSPSNGEAVLAIAATAAPLDVPANSATITSSLPTQSLQPEAGFVNTEATFSAPQSQLQSLTTALGDIGDAEVVCIIRPIGQPRTASRVVIINRATSKFIADLTGELEPQASPVTATARGLPLADVHGRMENGDTSGLLTTARRESVSSDQPMRYRRSLQSR